MSVAKNDLRATTFTPLGKIDLAQGSMSNQHHSRDSHELHEPVVPGSNGQDCSELKSDRNSSPLYNTIINYCFSPPSSTQSLPDLKSNRIHISVIDRAYGKSGPSDDTIGQLRARHAKNRAAMKGGVDGHFWDPADNRTTRTMTFSFDTKRSAAAAAKEEKSNRDFSMKHEDDDITVIGNVDPSSLPITKGVRPQSEETRGTYKQCCALLPCNCIDAAKEDSDGVFVGVDTIRQQDKSIQGNDEEDESVDAQRSGGVTSRPSRAFSQLQEFGRRTLSQKFRRGESRYSSSNKAIRSLLIVVLAFFICMTPFCISKLYKVVLNNRSALPGYVNVTATLFQYCSSAINPFIYAIFRKDFRQVYRRLLDKVFGKNVPRSSSISELSSCRI